MKKRNTFQPLVAAASTTPPCCTYLQTGQIRIQGLVSRLRLRTLDKQRGALGRGDEQGLLVHQAGHGKQAVGKLAHIERGEQLGLAHHRVRAVYAAPLGRFKLLDEVTWGQDRQAAVKRLSALPQLFL